jgi:hypothetical protein
MTIRHNTVVDNGGGTTPEGANRGGGIVYHDNLADDGTTPCYYCRPHGNAPASTIVYDNVIAYTAKAALRGMRYADRDYNLLYANNTGGFVTTPDCSYPATWRCYMGQYGGYNGVDALNDIFADPLFTDRANDDYTLTGSSPGSGTASDSGDRGAWGGSDPIDF